MLSSPPISSNTLMFVGRSTRAQRRVSRAAIASCAAAVGEGLEDSRAPLSDKLGEAKGELGKMTGEGKGLGEERAGEKGWEERVMSRTARRYCKGRGLSTGNVKMGREREPRGYTVAQTVAGLGDAKGAGLERAAKPARGSPTVPRLPLHHGVSAERLAEDGKERTLPHLLSSEDPPEPFE